LLLEDAALTHQIANLALVFILFQGGFSTKQVAVRQAALP
jgi:NhaP-type Na+/H+ and K+/H+ antiporter